MQLMQR